MGRLNVSGMTALETEWLKRKEALRTLTSVPFDLNNKIHLDAIATYNAHFEYSSSLMYIYQAMNEELKFAALAWFSASIVPIPDFIKYFISTFLYVGCAGYLLERFSLAEYHEELVEMKTLYNWCFKGGEDHYNQNIDNTEKLANPILQSLIKTLAPITSTDFLLAWPRQTVNQEETKSGWANVFSLGFNAVSSTLSVFGSSKKGVDLTRIRELKTAVETRQLDVGVFKGFINSIDYLTTHTKFKELLTAPVGTLTNMATNVATSVLYKRNQP